MMRMTLVVLMLLGLTVQADEDGRVDKLLKQLKSDKAKERMLAASELARLGADAKAAEEPALAWVGNVTGAAQAHGSALIVIADRKKADPNGKTINRLMKLAPN